MRNPIRSGIVPPCCLPRRLQCKRNNHQARRNHQHHPAHLRPRSLPATQPPTSAPPSAATRDSANKITVTGMPSAGTRRADRNSRDRGRRGEHEEVPVDQCLVRHLSKDAAGATTTSTVRSYRLVANEEALAPHAGKKIEVMGPSMAKPARRADLPATRHNRSSNPARSSRRPARLRAFRMIRRRTARAAFQSRSIPRSPSRDVWRPVSIWQSSNGVAIASDVSAAPRGDRARSRC